MNNKTLDNNYVIDLLTTGDKTVSNMCQAVNNVE